MTRHEMQSRLNRLFPVDAAKEDPLAEYLQILQPVPPPRLAEGRRRVVAEAARLSSSRAPWNYLLNQMAPRLSLTWALAIFLLIGAIAGATWASGPDGAGNLFFGLSSTPTVAWTRAPLSQASATVSLAPTPLSDPARPQIEMTTTPAPAPTPAPTLPQPPTAQSSPTH